MPLLEMKDLHTFFHTKRGIVKAVNGVSYSVDAGKTLGVVGESGSGKSVSAMSMLQLIDGNGYIDSGKIIFNGRDLTKLSRQEMYKIRGNDISVIFQEPMTSLNPVFTIERQISEPFMNHQGMKKAQAAREVVKMLADVKIPNPEVVAKQYPHQLSGGMRQRVMIAMALACQPQILIADEPTTALDVTIQAQILDLIREMNEELHSSVLFITHDLGVVSELCDTVIVMYTGHIVEQAPAGELFRDPKHPYTIGLLNAIPVITKDRKPLSTIEGMVPNPTERIKGCSFWPRCPHATERCRTVSPPMKQLSEERKVRCWLFEYQAAGKEA